MFSYQSENMSTNHFSTDLQEAPWWIQQQQQSMVETTQNGSTSSQQHKIPDPQQFSSWPPPHHHLQHQIWLNSCNSSQNHPTLGFNLSQEDNDELQELDDRTFINNTTTTTTREQEAHELEKEPMFEKPLTPSDVGKLNRLVIPKQHAEKHFPLGGDSGDKGLLLSFEDESGKCWRFRYSYWNSSQSYVLTKGWSRYVKEKRLDAGDIILFERHRSDNERLFIGWRRRGAVAAAAAVAAAQDAHGGGGGGGGGGWGRGTLYANHPYPVDVVQNQSQSHGVTVPFQADHWLHAAAGSVGQSHQTTSSGNSKTVRLFGVNLECQLDESEPSDASTVSSHSHSQSKAQGYRQINYSNRQAYNSSNRHNHMGITFSQEDASQMMMRNRQG